MRWSRRLGSTAGTLGPRVWERTRGSSGIGCPRFVPTNPRICFFRFRENGSVQIDGGSLGRFCSIPLFVDKQPCDPSRPRVQILVCAPDGKVYVPVVQGQRYVANRVGQVPSTNASLDVDCKLGHHGSQRLVDCTLAFAAAVTDFMGNHCPV